MSQVGWVAAVADEYSLGVAEKTSSYNTIAKSPDDKFGLLFNSLSGKLVQFPIAELSVVKHALMSEDFTLLKSRLKNLLSSCGAIILNDVDELSVIQYRYAEDIAEPELILSIMTTLQCNMFCHYCFEQRRNVKLDDKKCSRIVEFIENELKTKKSFGLDWYGGEPLLEADLILKWQSSIQQLCLEKNVTTSFSMTTNGYLLERSLCRQLVEAGISTFQITLDGPHEVHNARRPVRKDLPTSFETILANIKYASTIADINLRINIDAENIDSIAELFDVLKAEQVDLLKTITLKAIVPAQGVSTDTVISASSFFKRIEELHNYALEKKLNVYLEPTTASSFCCVNKKNQYIIDPELALYKCADAFDPEKEAIGWIDDHGRKHLNEKLKQWEPAYFMNDSNCLKCKYLPQCFGGCLLKRVTHKRDWCPEESYDLEGYTQLLYLHRIARS